MGMYMKVEGVDGDCKDEAHDKWIDIISWNWGAHHPSNMQTGGGTSGGTAQLDQLTVMAKTAASTATLMGLLLQATKKKIEIHVTLGFEGGRDSWTEVELENATISDLNQSHDLESGGTQQSFDSIVISFEKGKQTIWNQNEDQTRGASVPWEHTIGTGVTA